MGSLHLSRAARRRHGVPAAELGPRGALRIDDPRLARRLSERLNRSRARGRAPGPPTISAGELTALATLHEVLHHVAGVAGHATLPAALRAADARLGADVVDGVRAAFRDGFAEPGGPEPGHAPPRAAIRGRRARRQPPLRVPDEERTEALEELLLLAATNDNPAAAPLRDLFDDRPLRRGSAYPALLGAVEAFYAGRPGVGTARGSLVDLLRAPAAAAPTSLSGQLRWIRANWADLIAGLPGIDERILLALDVIAEEERGFHLRFGAGGPGGGPTAEPPSLAGLDPEHEAFSADSDWMPRVVMQAKSTHVWLDQLSRRYGREVATIDAIPDEELDRLASWGVTGLWLIGLWQRSGASADIKRRRGDADAVASAYAVDEYRIADDLGGDAAWATLRERAAGRGIRLAADMVPNHLGLDSHWVVEHPERFLGLDESPFPAYSFNGPDVSSDARVAIAIEDHYWDASDAAVVFRRTDRATGATRFLYHGNDGTSFPWNDTAQLDYTRAETREAVIETIVEVARRFPIIRFDAAMVLARRHVRRLWFPEPGGGGAIPSRAEHALSRHAFDAAMPAEFWREVVDRVAAEVPGTLLLAEAFWLMEGYFVRTLGMHRVYNSAFMHMLRDENGAGFRKLIRDTLEFDPEILKRYVNFMSNPDEKPAIEQFGAGDKYFGAATVLATLPGLPMLAHGQLEGLTERYGHEFRRARHDESPDGDVVARHEREIVPLLRGRARFAEVRDFRLYDLRTDDGHVDEHVLAYTNGHADGRSLVVFHDRFASTAGAIHRSAAWAERGADGSRRLVRTTLAEALGLPAERDAVIAFADARSGLTWLRTGSAIHESGLRLELDAYACRVFLDIRELPRDEPRWRRLEERLAGRPVRSLEDALRELDRDAVHAPLRALGSGSSLADVGAAIGGEPGRPGEPRPDLGPQLDEVERAIAAFLRAVASATGAPGSPEDVAAEVRRGLETAAAPRRRGGRPVAPLDAPVVVGRLLMSGIGGGRVAMARFDDLGLLAPLAAALRPLVPDDPAASAAAERVRALLDERTASGRVSRPGRPAAAAAAAARRGRSPARGAAGS